MDDFHLLNLIHFKIEYYLYLIKDGLAVYLLKMKRYIWNGRTSNFINRAPHLLANLFLHSFSEKKYQSLTNQLLTQIKRLNGSQWKTTISQIIDKVEEETVYIGIEDIINMFGFKPVFNCLSEHQKELLFEHPSYKSSLLKYEEQIFFIEDEEKLDLSDKAISDLTKLKGLENFERIRAINLEDNALKSIKGLEVLRNLEEINLENNEIELLIGFERFSRLKKLNLAHNKLTELNGLAHLSNLEHLDLSSNKILELNDRRLPPKATVDLTGNLILKLDLKKSCNHLIEYQVNDALTAILDEGDIIINIYGVPLKILKRKESLNIIPIP